MSWTFDRSLHGRDQTRRLIGHRLDCGGELGTAVDMFYTLNGYPMLTVIMDDTGEEVSVSPRSPVVKVLPSLAWPPPRVS